MSTEVSRLPCPPTCQGSPRETVGMVCHTCGRDYGSDRLPLTDQLAIALHAMRSPPRRSRWRHLSSSRQQSYRNDARVLWLIVADYVAGQVAAVLDEAADRVVAEYGGHHVVPHLDGASFRRIEDVAQTIRETDDGSPPIARARPERGAP